MVITRFHQGDGVGVKSDLVWHLLGFQGRETDHPATNCTYIKMTWVMSKCR